METKDLLRLTVDYLNDNGLFQEFLSFAEEKGEDRDKVEDSLEDELD